MNTRFLSYTAATALLAAGLYAQQPKPVYQTVNCLKVLPGKGAEYRAWVAGTVTKIMQARADAGEIVSWSSLRSVMPAGTEARCDYRSVTMVEGTPPAPAGAEEIGRALQKAGIKMTGAEYIAKRDSLYRLVASEMWRPRHRVGAPAKGHYLYLNYMKVHKMADYVKFENDVWKPLAEEWVKEGAQSGWLFSTSFLPGGTEVKYQAVSADIYPSWEALFKTRSGADTFKKVHPGKNYNEVMGSMSGLRDLARRELFVIEQRVAKK